MFYYPVAIAVKDHFASGMYFQDANNGPHTKTEIAKIVEQPPGLHQPHLLTTFEFIPDEDFQRECDCDALTAVASTKGNWTFEKLNFGASNTFQSPFVLCRNVAGQLYPWDDQKVAISALELIIIRQPYWASVMKHSAENLPLYDNFQSFLRSLK